MNPLRFITVIGAGYYFRGSMKISGMIFYAFLILFFLFKSSSYSDEPKIPVEPAVSSPDVEIPSFSNSIMESPVIKKNYLFLMKAEITFSDGNEKSGMLYLTDIIKLEITNLTSGKATIRKLMLYDISRIDIEKWQPLDYGGGRYYFMPVQYRIYTNGYDADSFYFNGNIALLNNFDFGYSGETNMLDTCFYDTWVEGKKKIFHWDNTKATMFGYDFEHPVDGIVVSLKLDKDYSWRGNK